MTASPLPRILIVDDLFGREVPGQINSERDNLCAKLLLRAVSLDGTPSPSRLIVERPVAEAVFYRGQRPVASFVGETVENDLGGVLDVVRAGWPGRDQAGRFRWSLVLVDLCFYTGKVTTESDRRTPGMPEGRNDDDAPGSYFGLKILDTLATHFPELPALVLSSKSRTEVGLRLSHGGGLGFIARDDDKACELLQQAIQSHALVQDTDELLVGSSLALLMALREVRRAARHGHNFIIRGERGTGKGLLADYAHRTRYLASGKEGPGRRRGPALVKVIPASLVGSADEVLSGLERRYAGGVEIKAGMLELANGGDLFIDEIADLTAEAQSHFLRVLHEKAITRVGGKRSEEINIRFLSATATTNEALDEVRPDLVDRLRAGGTVWLPSLTDRGSDIEALALRFVEDAERETLGAVHRAITPEAVDYLLNREWPGNVRQLRSLVFSAVARHPDVEYLVPGHLERFVPSLPARNISVGSLSKPLDVINSQDFLTFQSNVDFNTDEIAIWAGTFRQVTEGHHRMLGRMLSAALRATARRTVGNPTGEIMIHPAIKLLTGDQSLSASAAADMIKRILKPIENQLEGDLLIAYSVATRLRPSRAPSTKA